MGKLYIPENYSSKLGRRDTQRAIKTIKDSFQRRLAESLNLERITAPIFVLKSSGLNDDLNGHERKVEFTLREMEGSIEVVQSLAKWKRMALYRYDYEPGEGIYTDMNAIRRDDDMDNLHSVFVDQWDWESVITAEQRTLDTLKSFVSRIVNAVVDVKEKINELYPCLTEKFEREVFYITSQELEDMYPGLTAKERETEITREHKTVFIMQIGMPLASGEKHDGRAPDYDDWQLNGDILIWDTTLGIPIEISSMGIRVDAETLRKQLIMAGKEERMSFDYHSSILDGTLPLTIGGGIGQSRLCMLMLEKAHIGEVHVSVWPEEMERICAENGIFML
ncbi:MAG: aspartate--ammonia ligase [Clostridia bacterium]|nr:aspartate--ammonia ligase [Clostridia bacterium]